MAQHTKLVTAGPTRCEGPTLKAGGCREIHYMQLTVAANPSMTTVHTFRLQLLLLRLALLQQLKL
jgi:hypothetical protein